MSPLKVVVVEDSVTIRERLVEVLRADAAFDVIGQAGDGPTALQICEQRRPDVISLDMVLPGMSGLEVTRRIMSTRATPILVVSASTNRGQAFDTFEALQAGAVDVFEKSRMECSDAWIDELKSALRLVAKIRVVTRPLNRPAMDSGSSSAHFESAPQATADTARNLVVIGASTGGPAALFRILGELPRDFRLPILIALHMAPIFARPLAEWLNSHSKRRVRIATDGEPLPACGPSAPVILAPPDHHLILDRGRLRLTDDPERHSCRPSVDVLFESVAIGFGPRTVAGLLTGMGRDGATGLLALRQAQALTFAQDEASCAVFGMPREAIQIGAAELILPLAEIAQRLAKIATSKVEGGAA